MKRTMMMCFLTTMYVTFISTVCMASEVVMPSPPKMAIGDVFVYQRFNNIDDAKSGNNPTRTIRDTVTEVNGDEGFVMSTKKAVKHYNRDGNLTKRERENKLTVYSPFWPTYHYPMKIGDVYDVTFHHTYHKEHGDVTYRLTTTVVGWETITVPAGTFKALKIESRGTYEHPPNYVTADIAYTIWLAPAVKMRAVLYDEVRSWDGGMESRHESLKKFISQ